MGPRSSAQRRATQNSPASARSVPPRPSRVPAPVEPLELGISGSATSRGSPGRVEQAREFERVHRPGQLRPNRRGQVLDVFARPGSSAAATHRLTGARVRSIRRATISCFLPVLRALQQLLAEVVVHRWVSAAARGARERHGLRAGPVAAHEQLRAGAHEGQLRGAHAPAATGGEGHAKCVQDRARLVVGGAVHPHLAGQHQLAQLTRGDPLHGARHRPLVVGRRGRAGHPDALQRIGIEQRHGGGDIPARGQSPLHRTCGSSLPSAAKARVRRASSP